MNSFFFCLWGPFGDILFSLVSQLRPIRNSFSIRQASLLNLGRTTLLRFTNSPPLTGEDSEDEGGNQTSG